MKSQIFILIIFVFGQKIVDSQTQDSLLRIELEGKWKSGCSKKVNLIFENGSYYVPDPVLAFRFFYTIKNNIVYEVSGGGSGNDYMINHTPRFIIGSTRRKIILKRYDRPYHKLFRTRYKKVI